MCCLGVPPPSRATPLSTLPAVSLGAGIGAANQSVPLYLSEMAPSKYRGAMNILFQLATTIGILVAQLVNYGVRNWNEGWRLSLGLAAVPAMILTLGECFWKWRESVAVQAVCPVA